MNTDVLTFLLQVCDGNFPNGAFSHSFGLESLIEDGQISDAASFEHFLEDWFLLQVTPFDGLSTHLAWKLAIESNVSGLVELSTVASQTILPELSRAGALRVGQRTLKVLSTMLPEGVMARFYQEIRQNKLATTFSIALAVAAAEIGLGQTETVVVSLYTSVANMVAAAVRAIPLGQTHGQQILRTCREWIEQRPTYDGWTLMDLSGAAAQWEIAQMNHKFLDGKLFMS